MNIYQQNQKYINKTKIDREQQTIKLHLHDSQIQTDLITINNDKTSPQLKPMIIPTINSHTNGPLTATRNHSIPSNSNQKTAISSSSSPQTTPRLVASAIATTSTLTNKTAMAANAPAATLPPPLLTTASSHDIVDLTEEDEDDGTTRAATTQRTAPLRQVY